MKHFLLHIVVVLFFILLFTACSENRGETSVPEYSVMTSHSEASTNNKSNTPADDLFYKEMKEIMYNLRWGITEVSLGEILPKLDQYEKRDTITSPYIKFHLPNGYVGFLFYDENEMLTDIWMTDHFLTQHDLEALVVGETSYEELINLDLYALRAPGSYESITAHYCAEGVYLTRCPFDTLTPVLTSIEFIPNEEFHAQPLYRYGMTIPYILPKDRNME